ncbi:helix-turn-helix domain-containing protein [Parafrankia soli]|uniref:helix-turn-helix domain-containing protein n=1 Tax=Parafrankia soli TaxID=2599596 RepID=UPI003B846DFF
MRRLIGAVLRRLRQAQGRTLRDVAEAAQVSMPYLSEVERGRKEASSEVLAAICRALDIRLVDLLAEVMTELARYEPLPLPASHAVASHAVAVQQPGVSCSVAPGAMTLGGLAAAGVGGVAAHVALGAHVVVARGGRALRRSPGHRRRAFLVRLAARPGPGRPPAHLGAIGFRPPGDGPCGSRRPRPRSRTAAPARR